MNRQSQVFKSGRPEIDRSGPSSLDLVRGHIKVDPDSVNPEEPQYRELKVLEFDPKLKRGENYSG